MIEEFFTVKLEFKTSIDESTGEVKTECIKKSIDKVVKPTEVKVKKVKSKKEESSDPTLILEENKYYLNQAAISLTGYQPDDKLDIKYEKRGKEITPVLGNDEDFGTHNGNRLTKTFSVAYRGAKNEELSKYGTEFLVIPHPEKEGLYILKSKVDELKQALQDNEDIIIEDLDLQKLIDEDAQVTEVSASLFQL